MICKSYNYFFMNFANRANLEIIMLLRRSPLNVKTITEKTGMEQSAVSHNLRKLCNCNILNVEKRGRERVYSLNSESVVPIIELVEKHVKKHCRSCTKNG